MLEVERTHPKPVNRSAGARVTRGIRSSQARRVTVTLIVLCDLFAVYMAFVGAYWFRYVLRIGPAIRVGDRLGFESWEPLTLPLLALMLATLWSKGAYRLRLGDEVEDDLASAFSSATISVATLVVLTSMLHQYQYSRAVIIYLWIALILFVSAGRWLFRALLGYFHRRGVAVRRLLVVGATDAGKMIMQSVAGRRDLGYELVGFVHTQSDSLPNTTMRSLTDFGRFRNLGFTADTPNLLRQERVDEVIIALPAEAHAEILPILSECEREGIGFKLVPDMFELSLGQVRVDDLGGIPIFDVRERSLRRLNQAVKQVVDWVLGAVLAVIFAPLMLLIALLIRMDSRGPVFYCQERVGYAGRHFTCYKFRSMHQGAEERLPEIDALNETAGVTFKAKQDPRFTRLGRFLRRHSLDELPQLFNVLKGEMSLVGPRPPLPGEVSRYDAWHHRRLQVRPGMTGMWQVSGRSDLLFDEMMVMDIYYIENWSIRMDIKILLRTVAAMVTGRGAY